MEYKGYHAKVDFDYTDQIFVGEVLGKQSVSEAIQEKLAEKGAVYG